MKRIILFLLAIVIFASSCVKDRVPEKTSGPASPGDRVLIHYWNFNGSSLLAPTLTVGGGSIVIGNTYDAVTAGTVINARAGDDSGSALRVRNPSTTMIIKAPTSGCRKPLLSFAVMRTDSGPQQNIISYTVDGTNYITTGLTANAITVTTDWTAYSYDFADIAETNNNPNFAVKITFATGNDGTSGNDRYDNISVFALKDSVIIPPPSNGDTLMYYWHFNGSDSSKHSPDFTLSGLSGASYKYYCSYVDFTTGSTLNLQAGAGAGNCLRVRNPSDSLVFWMPTTGYKNIVLKFAEQASSLTSGSTQNALYYTLDGTSFITTGLSISSYNVDTTFALNTFNFSSISGANNNPKFGVKIVFVNNHTGTSGNDRFDNLSLNGTKQ